MRLLLSALLLILPLPHALAGERPADYARGLPLETPGQEPFYRIELPFEVHAGARADLRDVRVFNAAGEAVPMSIVPVRPLSPDFRPEYQQVPVFPLPAATAKGNADLDVTLSGADGRILSLRSRGPARTGAPVAGAVLDLSRVDSEVTGLELAGPAPAANYSDTVRVESSGNLRDWQPVAEAALVDMRYGGQHLEQRRVELPRGRYRYLRLRAGTGLPALDRVQVVLPPSRPAPVLAWREVAGVRGKEEGDIEFDLGAVLAIEQLGVRLPDTNMVVPARFEARLRRDEDWRPVAGQTLYRIRQQERELVNPVLEPGLVAARYWRLRVDPRAGGTGSTPPVLRAGWRPQQVVFVARGQGPWQLAWGRRSAPAAQLPLGTLLPGYRDGDENRLVAAHPGAAVDLGGTDVPAPGADDSPATDWKRWLLWGVLLAGVAVLAAMARSLLRQPRPKD